LKQEKAKKEKKAKKTKKSGQRDKDWYKDKYPGKTDAELAMIMLADAMGNTDNPDDDPNSVGDNEKSGSSESSSGWDEDSPTDGRKICPTDAAMKNQRSGRMPEEPASEQDNETSGEEKPELPVEPEQPKPPAAPETMTVQIDAKGTKVEFVKDPTTGEWVNPETVIPSTLSYKKQLRWVGRKIWNTFRRNEMSLPMAGAIMTNS
jgi:hypothetical protein